MPYCHFRRRQGAEDIVTDRLIRRALHQGNVLVRGGMEDNRRAVLGEDLLHCPPVADVRDYRNRSHAQGLHQLLLNFIN